MNKLYQQKTAQALTLMDDHQLDVWIILTSEGSDPCLPLIPGVKTVGPGAFVFSRVSGAYAVCSSIDAQDIEESGLFRKVIRYEGGGLSAPLAALIKELKPVNIAVNTSVDEPLADGLTTGRFRWLKKALADVYQGSYASSEPVLTALRSIKTPQEVERIKKAVAMTEDIYDTVIAQIRSGMSEEAVGSLFIKEMEKRGVVNGVDRRRSMPIVMKGNIAHRPPGKAVIERGDLVIMDFSVDYRGYVSDIARTVYLLREGEKEAPAEIQEAFRAVHRAVTLAMEAVKPGIPGYEVDAAARSSYVSKGLPEITHATGHQIGRSVHDGGALLGPRWGRYGSSPHLKVEEGMVFTIEPTLFLEDGIHFIVEENVLVTADGVQCLSKRQDELICIPPSPRMEKGGRAREGLYH